MIGSFASMNVRHYQGKPCTCGATLRYRIGHACVACASARSIAAAKVPRNIKAAKERRVARLEAEAARPQPFDDLCECCGQITPRMFSDHDHTTGQFRGWVCNGCNVRLAPYGHGPEALTRAQLRAVQVLQDVDYLNRSLTISKKSA